MDEHGSRNGLSRPSSIWQIRSLPQVEAMRARPTAALVFHTKSACSVMTPILRTSKAGMLLSADMPAYFAPIPVYGSKRRES